MEGNADILFHMLDTADGKQDGKFEHPDISRYSEEEVRGNVEKQLEILRSLDRREVQEAIGALSTKDRTILDEEGKSYVIPAATILAWIYYPEIKDDHMKEASAKEIGNLEISLPNHIGGFVTLRWNSSPLEGDESYMIQSITKPVFLAQKFLPEVSKEVEFRIDRPLSELLKIGLITPEGEFGVLVSRFRKSKSGVSEIVSTTRLEIDLSQNPLWHELKMFLEQEKAKEAHNLIITSLLPNPQANIGIRWEASPLQKGEYYTLLITDSLQNKALTLAEKYIPFGKEPEFILDQTNRELVNAGIIKIEGEDAGVIGFQIIRHDETGEAIRKEFIVDLKKQRYWQKFQEELKK